MSKISIYAPGDLIKLRNLSPTLRGKTCLYSTNTVERTVDVDLPNYMVEPPDADLLGLGDPLSYPKNNKIMTLNPLYHSHVKLDGDIRVNYPATWFADSYDSATFGSETWESELSRHREGFEQYISAPLPFLPDILCRDGARLFKATPYAAYSVIGVECYLDQVGLEQHLRPYVIEFAYDVVYQATDTGKCLLIPGATELVTSHIQPSVLRDILWNYATENAIRDPEELKPLLLAYLHDVVANASKPSGEYSPYYGPYNPIGTLPSIDLVALRVKDALSRVVTEQRSFRGHFAWGELAAEAYQDLDYVDNNGIQYLKEATEIRESAVSYADTLRKVALKSGKKRAKALAAAYLGVHYGWKLTLMDTADYVKELRKNSLKDEIHRCASFARKTVDDWTVTARYNVFYKAKDVGDSSETKQINAFLKRVDFLPTLENMWDSVPYSFVLDWFTNIGNNLTSIGNLNILRAYYTTLGAIQSVRAVRKIPIARLLGEQVYYSGEAQYIIYERRISKLPDPPAFQPKSQHSASSLNHAVEGVALVVSKLF